MQDTLPHPRQFTLRAGRVKMVRLGSLDPKRQVGNDRAPARRGLWAFPHPVFDLSFAVQQHYALLPKRLRYPAHGDTAGWAAFDARTVEERDAWLEEQRRWLDEVAPSVCPVRTFWWDGPVWAHFDHAARIEPAAVKSEWYLHPDPHGYVQALRKAAGRGHAVAAASRARNGPWPLQFGVDHLEVFLPAGRTG